MSDLAEHEDDHVATGTEPAGGNDASSPSIERRSEPSADRRAPDDKSKSLRDILKSAADEHREPREPSKARQDAAAQRQREATGKFAPAAGKDNAAQPSADGGKTASPPATAQVSNDGKTTSQPAATSQTSSVEAPAALAKEVRAIWNTLPAQVQAEFARRENDTAEGVRKLQDRYRPIEDALAPVRPLLQQRGITEGQAVKQLFDWHHALAGPNKVTAARELLRSHGIDPSQLAAPQGAAPRDGQDPNQAPHPFLQQLASRTETLEQTIQRQRSEAAANEIAKFAKDRPHFDRVRPLMGSLIQTGQASDMEDAYNKAIWADPDVRGLIQREAEEKRAAEVADAEAKRQKDAADAEEARKRKDADDLAKARRAGVSPSGRAPAGRMPIAKDQHGKSVGSSIRDAIRQTSGAI